MCIDIWNWAEIGHRTMDPLWSEIKRILRRHEDIFEGSRIQIFHHFDRPHMCMTYECFGISKLIFFILT
jgi:hypothetical protein